MAIATLQLRTHERPAGLLVGSVDFEDFVPACAGAQKLQPATVQSLPVWFSPIGVPVLRQQVARKQGQRRIKPGLAGQRPRRLSIETLGIYAQLTHRPEHQQVAIARDGILPAERTPPIVHSLAQVGCSGLGGEFRPERFHHLIAMQPVLWRQSQQLDEIGASPVAPSVRSHRAPIQLHAEASQ